MRPAVRRTAPVVLVLLALVLSGCVRLPDDGPVVEAGARGRTADHPAGEHDPVPPEPGASRQAIVSGFLDAMTGWPNQINVAKQFLTTDAAEAWNPEAGTIVYADTLPAQEAGGRVTVQLTDADRLDASRAWRASLTRAELRLDFELTVEDGEFRIVDPPDALVVPSSWFQQRFQQVSLYYFDPGAQILVPEPVFVPEGEQLATSLVNALLTGPSQRLAGVVRTFVPEGLDAGLSVPVSDGVAEIALSGDRPLPSLEEAELMLAQLAWTLRQDPSIEAVRVTIGGQPLPLPGGASTYDVSEADAYDPAGAASSTVLYGLQRGRLRSGGPGGMNPTAGPFGDGTVLLEDVAVAPRADRAAGVLPGRTAAVVGPMTGPGELDRVRTIFDGAVDLARPTWDYTGRLWLLERRPEGARVHLYENRRLRTIEVSGVTGTDARRLLVSRDGTRLVAVVREGGGDRVVISRVFVNGSGRVQEVVHSTVAEAVRGAERVVDIAWTSPSTIAVLTPASPGRLFEVDTVVADGASVGEDVLSTIVNGPVVGLAASPDETLPRYAVTAESVVDLAEQSELGIGARFTALDYVG